MTNVALAQQQIEAASGEKYALSATDKTRGENQLVRFTVEYYRKNPTNAAGVDVLVRDNKIVEIRDRASAVYLEKKPDPGALKPEKNDDVLSANGAARKWVIANLKVGDAIKIGTVNVARAANGEVLPDKSAPCFPGAYYRKAASSFDVWTGIVGTIKLPKPQIDEARLDATDKQPLDNFSIYLGGRAGSQEIDAGLTWEYAIDAQGNKSAQRTTFRPFWRNEKWNSNLQPEYNFNPGDVVTLAVLVAAPGKLRLVVADARNPQRVFQTEFDAKGFQPRVPRQFKRVNAIDQRRNEGKPVQATSAKVTGAEWIETYLLRGEGTGAQRVDLIAARFTDMRCPDAKHASVMTTDNARGAEKIDIYGKP